jgi:osmotically-inducible protein OsmY
MKTNLKILALTGLATGFSLGGLPLHAQDASSASSKTATSQSTPAPTSSSAGTSAGDGLQTSKDNVSTTTANQTQDRNESTVPVVQSNAAEDLKVTQQIKQALRDASDLSMKAKHARVVTTADRQVYLWGKVKDEKEQARVVEIAQPFVGDRVLKSKLQLPDGTKTAQNK